MLCLQAAVIVAQFNFVERLGLVHLEAVQGAHLVGMRIGFRGPGSAVPKLTAGGVARHKFVAGVSNLEFLVLVKFKLGAAVAPVRAVMSDEGALEAGAEGGRAVVQRLVVGSRSQLSAGAVTARVGVQLTIDSATLVSSVETGGGEFVVRSINHLVLENLTSLLSLGLTQVVVVHANTRHVALVARENR